MQILIVEDDLQAADAMERGLVEAGHDCARAADGEEGLGAARDGEFDVMIVDRMMPKMNGVQLIETLRREGDQTPVLFLSALGEVGDRVAGLQAGRGRFPGPPPPLPPAITPPSAPAPPPRTAPARNAAPGRGGGVESPSH